MKISILLTLLFLILNPLMAQVEEEEINNLAQQMVIITENIDEVQVDEFEEDQETVTYWYNNSLLQQLINRDSILSQEPCSKGEGNDEEDKEKKVKKTKLTFLMRFKDRKILESNLPLTGTPKVAFYLNEVFRKPASDRNDILSQAKDDLSFQEKIKLGSYIGSRFSRNYDYDRAEDGTPESKGLVTLDELIEGYNENDRSGVCRDIALGQVQILSEMGLNCKVTTYSTSGAGGHATVACTDPSDPDKIVKLNYGNVTTSNQAGALALDADSGIPDLTVAYQLYDKQGKYISSVHTDLGKIMAETAGAKAKEIDLQERFDSSIAQVEIGNYGRVFFGNTEEGHAVVGIAGDRNLMNRGVGPLNFNLDTGASLAHVKPAAVSDNEHAVFYARVNGVLSTKNYKLGDSTSVRANLSGNYSSAIHFGIGKENKDEKTAKYMFNMTPSIIAETKLSNRTVASLEIGRKYDIGDKDVRDMAQGIHFGSASNYVHSTLDHEISESISLLTTATVVSRHQLGTTGQLSAGVSGNSFQTILAYDSRLDSTTPGYIPGATPTLSLSHQQDLGAGWSVTGGGSQTFTTQKEKSFFVSIKKKF